MISQDELQALVLLLNRVPMNLPERLLVSSVLGKIEIDTSDKEAASEDSETNE